MGKKRKKVKRKEKEFSSEASESLNTSGKRSRGTKNLTQGSPTKLIIGFAVPMLLGLLFQQFYSMVDTMIVGKWLGVTSLAAVGSIGSLNFMVIGFCTGVCTGFAIPVAQCFGAGNYRVLRKFVANSFWVSAAFAAVLTVTVCLACYDILVIMKTPDDIIGEAYQYIFVIFLGIPVTFLYNLLSGIIRALGDSKTPVYFLLMSSVINIVLDIVSIAVLHMGVEGPAWATVISQGVSGILCLVYMLKRFEILRIKKDEWKVDLRCIGTLFATGVPMGLQYSITAIGSVVLQSSVNTLGSSYVASVTAGSKVSLFFCCPFDALGGTMATYAGQNIGAKLPDRISKGIKSACLIGSVYAAAAFGVLYFFGKTIALLFLDSDQIQILDRVQEFLFANSLFYIPLTVLNVMRFSIQGMGYSVLAILAGVCEMVARVVVGFGIVPIVGYVAVCYASPLAWIMADLFLIPAYFACLKKKKKLFANELKPDFAVTHG